MMRSSTTSLSSRLALPATLAILGLASALAAQPAYQDILTLPVSGDRIVSAVAVTVDEASGEIFVCDERGDRILIFDDQGMFRFEIPGGQAFSAPRDLAVDRDGYLFLLTAGGGSRGRMHALDFDGQPLAEFELGDLPPELPQPILESLAISADGSRLAVLDSRNNSIWITDRDGRIERRIDLTTELTDDQREDLFPTKLDIYGDRIVVAMASLAEVWCYELDGSSCGRVGKKGGGECGLLFPTAAALDASGNYLVVEQQRMFVLHWNGSSNECMGEFYGPGDAPGFFYYPYDLFLDSAGQMYVAQSYKGKVQVYSGLSPAPTPPSED